VSTKVDKFKSLMSSPNGSIERKKEIIGETIETKSEVSKKKATFELSPELHRWLKMHAVETGKNMVDIVESLLLDYQKHYKSKL
jgi:hemerythrin